MDETRKLLDSLMGQTRDQSLAEAKKTKGENFRADNVCKAFLLGYCPQSELFESKMAGKRNIKECKKMHSDAVKAEFERHKDKQKFQAEYEKQILPMLDSFVREADAWVARERANIKGVAGEKLTVNQNTMEPEVSEQYEQLKTDMNKMIAAAEIEAEKGNVEGSKFKVMLADEIKEKVLELEDKHIVSFDVTQKGEEVCETCGSRYEALTAKNEARYRAHFQGKVHLAYVKIRDWIKELRKNELEGEKRHCREERERRNASQERDRGGDRERRRSRSRRDRDTRDRDRGGDRARGDRGDYRGDRDRRDRSERGDYRGDRDRDRDRRR